MLSHSEYFVHGIESEAGRRSGGVGTPITTAFVHAIPPVRGLAIEGFAGNQGVEAERWPWVLGSVVDTVSWRVQAVSVTPRPDLPRVVGRLGAGAAVFFWTRPHLDRGDVG